MVARLVRDQEVVGSSPVASTIGSPHKNYVDFRSVRGVAQLVARSVRDAEVVGSNPVASTKKSLYFKGFRKICPQILPKKLSISSEKERPAVLFRRGVL